MLLYIASILHREYCTLSYITFFFSITQFYSLTIIFFYKITNAMKIQVSVICKYQKWKCWYRTYFGRIGNGATLELNQATVISCCFEIKMRFKFSKSIENVLVFFFFFFKSLCMLLVAAETNVPQIQSRSILTLRAARGGFGCPREQRKWGTSALAGGKMRLRG